MSDEMAYESKSSKRTKEGILEMLRADLIGELQAINQYQTHIDDTDDEEVKHVLSHIRDDEKEHVAELTKLIRKKDPTQDEKFKKEKL